MKELTCAFTLTLVSLVAATPHGYGVKGGAKAEASAVAGSLSGLPLSIPSGSGFSGSFSKSASSSFASSSASSSSSSFSYSGSGNSGVTGYGTKNDGDCSNGGCHKNVAGSQGLSGFESNGFPVHGSANAAATAGAIALAGSPGSSKDNSLTCTSGECSNQSSENINSGTNLSGPSRSDSAAKSGTGYESNNKCASGKCGLTGHPTEFTAPEYEPSSQFGAPSINYGPTRNCASGKCGPVSQPGAPLTNYRPDTNCASGKCGSASAPGAPLTNYEPSYNCASGKCGSAYQSGLPSTNYGSSGDCTSGKCETGSQPGAPLINHEPNTNCASGKCGSTFPSDALSTQYGPDGKCAIGQCGPTSSSKAPSSGYGPSGAGLNNCQSGHCEPNTLTAPAIPNYEPNDIPVIISGTSTPKSTQDFKEKLSNYDKTSTDCAFGNCGQPTSPNFKPSYPDKLSTTYENTNLPNQNQGSSNFGYNSAFGSGLASGYNKPASHLTTPKQSPSYTPGNTFDTSHIQTTYTPSGGKTCTSGNCDYNSSKGPSTSSEPEAKCTSSNCAPNTYNNEKPKIPGQSTAPGYQIPTGPHHGSPSCAFGNCAYPSAQPTIGFSSGQYKPSYSHNQASQQTPLGSTGSVGFPSFPSTINTPLQSGHPSFNTPTGSDATSCKTPNCASHPLITDTSAGTNSQPGISKPSTPEQKVPIYTGGFGGPAGILKPIEFSTASIGINKPNYPLGPSSHPAPTEGIGFPSHPSGFGTSPTPLENPSATIPGVPSYNTPTGSASTNCKTPDCGSFPSAGAAASAGATSQSIVPSSIGSSKPSSSDQKLPAYTGGFGGPAGVLKPNEFSTASIGINKPNYSHGPSSHPVPTEGIGFPSHPSGFGTSPTVLNNPSATITGVPSFNTPTGSATTNCKTPNCGSFPSAGTAASAGATSQSIVPSAIGGSKPSSSDQKLPVYTGGFGGPAGVLKPNDFSISTQVPASNLYSKPTIPTGTYNPAACTTGNCGLQSPLPHVHDSSLNKVQASAIAAASANAEADAVAYTGGFGGPPGLLKPYDDGKLSSSDLIKHSPNSQFGLNHDVSSSGIHSSYGSDNNKYGAGSQAGLGGNAVAGAQASAAASSGSVSGILNGYGTYPGHYNNDHKGPGECGGDCGSNASGSYRGGSQFGHNGGLGLTKHGHHDGLGSNLARSESGATAKSLAGAVSGANTFGASGSFASSSATAHASAGAGTKGGYYGR